MNITKNIFHVPSHFCPLKNCHGNAACDNSALFVCVRVFVVTWSNKASHPSSFIKGFADPLNAKCSCVVVHQRRFQELLVCLIYFRLGFKKASSHWVIGTDCQLLLNQFKALNVKFKGETSDTLLRATLLETSKAAGSLRFKSRESQSNILKRSGHTFGSSS